MNCESEVMELSANSFGKFVFGLGNLNGGAVFGRIVQNFLIFRP
jgi:hypothetical protein